MADTESIAPALDAADARALEELDALVRETHLLWDEEWVGFSWRNYTYEHMQRVRGLSRTLGRAEGGDARVIEFAATLHDVTKSYDGEIVVGPDGQRVLDGHGFWKNDTLPPRRTNRVTAWYDRLGLQGTLHNVSGGRVAAALLEEAGFRDGFRARVDQAIREHLLAGPESSLEGRVLYDADTVDANIGLPAFYRNIQISLRGQDRQYARRGECFADWLRANLPAFLEGYLKERIPTWIEGKERDFVPKMTTESGRRLAGARIARLRRVNAELVAELEGLEEALEVGRLAVVRYFMEHRGNPQLTQQLGILEERWAVSSGGEVDDGHVATSADQPAGSPRGPRPAGLLRLLRSEVAGEA
jgi:HD superfamily phosphohydrolase YqeK